MSNYYIFDRDCIGRWLAHPDGDDENSPEVDWYYWRRGAALPNSEIIPDPILYTLQPLSQWSADDSPHMPSYFRGGAPLFSDELIAALRACGVDTLATYNVAIRDPDNGQIYTNYKAVNIVSLVAAADMQKSNATIHGNGPAIIDVDFDGLVVDENKAGDNLFFRLAESTNAILVHESVRDHLLRQGFTDLAFRPPGKTAL
jgi:hypothetical protein